MVEKDKSEWVHKESHFPIINLFAEAVAAR